MLVISRKDQNRYAHYWNHTKFIRFPASFLPKHLFWGSVPMLLNVSIEALLASFSQDFQATAHEETQMERSRKSYKVEDSLEV